MTFLSIILLGLSALIAAGAGVPEDGPYNPTIPDVLQIQTEKLASAGMVKPWKPAAMRDYGGRYVSLSQPGATLEVQVKERNAVEDPGRDMDATWNFADDLKKPRVVRLIRAPMETESRHTYAYAARGTVFLFFVRLHRGAGPGEGERALVVGEHVFVWEKAL